jgi:hypothetical protein
VGDDSDQRSESTNGEDVARERPHVCCTGAVLTGFELVDCRQRPIEAVGLQIFAISEMIGARPLRLPADRGRHVMCVPRPRRAHSIESGGLTGARFPRLEERCGVLRVGCGVDAFVLCGRILRVGKDPVASGGVVGQVSDVAPDGRPPIRIIIAFLRTLQTIARSVIVLTSETGSVAVQSIVGQKQV